MSYFTKVPSPIGELLLLGDGEKLNALYMNEANDYSARAAGSTRDDAAFAAAAEQLDAYFAGDLTRFELELEPIGTPFRTSVWQALTEIPYGETRSYGEIAARIGNPKASRAVGMANNTNPIAVIIPCHRVVGSNGALVGYAGGLERKQLLLDLERR
jgi:methylated-DNA-[protein]-cysteine S-methyltransferase